VSPNKLRTALYQSGEFVKRPPAKNLTVKPVSKPECQAVTSNRSDDGGDEQDPRFYVGGGCYRAHGQN
jgi:hypothetical protein